MSNTAVAELVTYTITGTPVRAGIAEILDYRTGGDARVADVRLVAGAIVRNVDTLDIEVGSGRGVLAAA